MTNRGGFYSRTTLPRLVKDHGPRRSGFCLPTPRDTKPLVASVRIRAWLSVNPVTGVCDVGVLERFPSRCVRVERTFRSASSLPPKIQAFNPLHRSGLKALLIKDRRWRGAESAALPELRGYTNWDAALAQAEMEKRRSPLVSIPPRSGWGPAPAEGWAS